MHVYSSTRFVHMNGRLRFICCWANFIGNPTRQGLYLALKLANLLEIHRPGDIHRKQIEGSNFCFPFSRRRCWCEKSSTALCFWHHGPHTQLCNVGRKCVPTVLDPVVQFPDRLLHSNFFGLDGCSTTRSQFFWIWFPRVYHLVDYGLSLSASVYIYVQL